MPGFGKQARLLTPADFDAAFKKGKRMGSGPLLAVIAPNELGHARIGFALAKRHAKTAVQRNRIRRQIRERFRLEAERLGALDLVVTLRAKPPTLRPLEAQVVADFFNSLLKRCASTP